MIENITHKFKTGDKVVIVKPMRMCPSGTSGVVTSSYTNGVIYVKVAIGKAVRCSPEDIIPSADYDWQQKQLATTKRKLHDWLGK